VRGFAIWGGRATRMISDVLSLITGVAHYDEQCPSVLSFEASCFFLAKAKITQRNSTLNLLVAHE
jgi:hypothetical protein